MRKIGTAVAARCTEATEAPESDHLIWFQSIKPQDVQKGRISPEVVRFTDPDGIP